jgi:hypothetical protein
MDQANLVQMAMTNTADGLTLDYAYNRSLYFQWSNEVMLNRPGLTVKFAARSLPMIDASIGDIRHNLALYDDAEPIEAYEARRKSNRPVLPSATWKSIPKKAKTCGSDQFDKDKLKILSSLQPSRTSTPSLRSAQTYKLTLPVNAEKLSHLQETISVLTHLITGREKL